MTDQTPANQLRAVYGFRYRPRLKYWSDGQKHLIYRHEVGYATSYHWWKLAIRLPNGEWVLNTHRYSPQTNQHRYMLSRFFEANGIKPTYEVEASKGLCEWNQALKHLNFQKEKAWILIDKPRIRQTTRERLHDRINYLNHQIITIGKIIDIEQGRTEQAIEGSTEGVVNL